ncbi:ABC transporter permease DevC [Opitutus sp. ER46]|uniref:ABC transporter permease DevC n=1 Tax=Opitutus sp. ER46 TaxID=2161864 RepID=UPI000D305ECB|nr:ABC transporter permease DevC [Opitutus sp. ER46]PTX91750.1 ABC transporter [Opitutus sp. ER46]
MKGRLFPLGAPLSWLQLRSDPHRFATAVAGVAFAAVMMLFQLGLVHELFARAVALHERLNADLVMVGREYSSLAFSFPFAEERLYQSRGDAAVASVSRLYVAFMPWRNPATQQRQANVMVLAFRPDETPLALPDLVRQAALLKRVGTALYDRDARRNLGPVAELLQAQGPFYAELQQRRLQIAGTFALGPTFSIDASVAMSEETFLEQFSNRRGGLVDLGLIRLRPGRDPAAVARHLERRAGPDVRVLTKAELIRLEQKYWRERTPIGFTLLASMLVAFFVGAVVVYQILYGDVAEHLPEYATLKAIGFDDRFLVRLIIEQALTLSVVGMLPAVLAATGLSGIMHAVTGLTPAVTWSRFGVVFALTVGMCGIAGLLATRKLRHARPAEVF